MIVLAILLIATQVNAEFFCLERTYPPPFDKLTNLYCFDTDDGTALITNKTVSGLYDTPQHSTYSEGVIGQDVRWYMIDGTAIAILEISGAYFTVNINQLKRIPERE